ncbi:hypothetical protein HanIR_Chr13g0626341 [Helianthus annuus]|nr:hypothetical protein HanIR_Chr13g0626341 [Helianthus annuus]
MTFRLGYTCHTPTNGGNIGMRRSVKIARDFITLLVSIFNKPISFHKLNCQQYKEIQITTSSKEIHNIIIKIDATFKPKRLYVYLGIIATLFHSIIFIINL